MLSRWTEYTWQQANEECNLLNNESTLWYLDEDGVDPAVQKLFLSFSNATFWLAANYSEGITSVLIYNSDFHVKCT